MPTISEDSLKRISATDDALAAALARLPSAERMRHAPTVGVVKVLFGAVRTLAADVPGETPDDWTPLLDRLEPQFALCEAAATVRDLIRRFEALDGYIGRLLPDLVVLAEVVEPHYTERDRLLRLTMLAQQEILTLAGEQLDRKLSHVERALSRHRGVDEARTGQFHEALREFKDKFVSQAARQAAEQEARAQRWDDEFTDLTGRLKAVAEVEQVERITSFYGPAERQERIRVNTYAGLCVFFFLIAIALLAVGLGFYAPRSPESSTPIVGSVSLFGLLSSAAAYTQREQRVHRTRLWAVEGDHRRMVMSILFFPGMPDAQRERLVEKFFNEGFRGEVPKPASTERLPKDPRTWLDTFKNFEKEK